MRRRPAQIFPENPGPGFVAQSGRDIDIPGPHGIFRICGICGEGEVSEICGQGGARTSENHQNGCRQIPRPKVVDLVRKLIILARSWSGALERGPGRGATGVSRQGPRAGIYVVLAAEMERRAHWASYLSPQLHCHVRGAHQADRMSALLPAHLGELCGVHRVIRIRVLCATCLSM